MEGTLQRKGPWTPQEDFLLRNYIQTYGAGQWRTLPKKAGLERCGKGCRLRWMNYLRPNVKRGNISRDEEDLIIRLHKLLGNRWALIAGRVPGRTDNEIKNYWNTHLKKKLRHNISDHHHNATDYNSKRSISYSDRTLQEKLMKPINADDDPAAAVATEVFGGQNTGISDQMVSVDQKQHHEDRLLTNMVFDNGNSLYNKLDIIDHKQQVYYHIGDLKYSNFFNGIFLCDQKDDVNYINQPVQQSHQYFAGETSTHHHADYRSSSHTNQQQYVTVMPPHADPWEPLLGDFGSQQEQDLGSPSAQRFISAFSDAAFTDNYPLLDWNHAVFDHHNMKYECNLE